MCVWAVGLDVMNIELHRFITKMLWIRNDPLHINDCIRCVMSEFGMSRAGAETAVNRVLSERP